MPIFWNAAGIPGWALTAGAHSATAHAITLTAPAMAPSFHPGVNTTLLRICTRPSLRRLDGGVRRALRGPRRERSEHIVHRFLDRNVHNAVLLVDVPVTVQDRFLVAAHFFQFGGGKFFYVRAGSGWQTRRNLCVAAFRRVLAFKPFEQPIDDAAYDRNRNCEACEGEDDQADTCFP